MLASPHQLNRPTRSLPARQARSRERRAGSPATSTVTEGNARVELEQRPKDARVRSLGGNKKEPGAGISPYSGLSVLYCLRLWWWRRSKVAERLDGNTYCYRCGLLLSITSE